MTRHEASEAQISAADPAKSVWLAANAGSGKTRVLIDRVARLLLGGTSPERILCLTYTKAAASEMQNRLFSRLGRWAMLDEVALRSELAALDVGQAIDHDALSRARRLFARAIETPGGLKIQTIHSFCAALLRRFPLEAGVSPDFRELDDRKSAQMRQEIVEMLAAGADIDAVDALASIAASDDPADLLAEICRNSDGFQTQPHLTGEDMESLLSDVFQGGEARVIGELVPLLLKSSTRDSNAGARLADFEPDLSGLVLCEGLFLTGPTAAAPFSAKIGDFPTKSLREHQAAPLMPAIESLMRRVQDARPRRIAIAAASKARALHHFASAFLPRYEAAKAAAGYLDFDDLIQRAARLLSDRSVAAWVLYRLDGGIDHILVDEAQDTSPGQWQVIKALSEEFTAGEGARGHDRRIFVVGDKKQSIYSFQGADLETFDRIHDEFELRHRGAGAPFATQNLHFSFRSSPAILKVVDLTFDERVRRGLGGQTQHRAFHGDMPGRVDLWEPIAKGADPDAKKWDEPVDLLPSNHHTVVLAEKVAHEIAQMKAEGVQIEVRTKSGGTLARPVHEGDFLILVRRRSPLFHEIIRACKARGLAVAGTDRLLLSGELAVKDLTALLSFLATPDDDLSLAEALRSPLFGWDEGRLYTLAQERGDKEYLWQALRAKADAHLETSQILTDLRDKSDFLRPYELLERVLTRHGGRQRLVGRLGREAEDGIDAFLAEALNYERTDVPSLTGFLAWMQTGKVEVKRRLDQGARAVRVMTVHGAKGLEAPIVILPDCGDRRPRDRGLILRPGGGAAVWRVPKDESPPELAEELTIRARKEEEEQARLLYVAMTRAESWLIVAAAGDAGEGAKSWHGLIRDAMIRAGAAERSPEGAQWTFGEGLRLTFGDWPPPDRSQARDNDGANPTLPVWLTQPAAPAMTLPAPVSPTSLPGAKALPGEAGLDEAAAKRRGTLLHLLLEQLPAHPAAHRKALGPEILQHAGCTDPAETETILAEAARVLDAPGLAHIFGPDTLAEVELSAELPEADGRLVHGIVDRLIVSRDHVLAVDFKSNTTIPQASELVPEGILRQLGFYAAMLQRIYPDRRVDVAVVWTRTAQLMPIPLNIVRAAMQSATLP